MSENELSSEQLKEEVSHWMAELFDKDVLVEDVKSHVTALTQKIVATKLKHEVVTIKVFKDICKVVEDEFRQRRENNT